MRTTLTAFVPAHKQTNPEHAPGQQVNPVNPLGFTDTTLGDYIRRKDGIHKAFEAVKKECCGNPLRGCMNCPPKLTFAEWFKQRTREFDSDSLITFQDIEIIAKEAWEFSKEN